MMDDAEKPTTALSAKLITPRKNMKSSIIHFFILIYHSFYGFDNLGSMIADCAKETKLYGIGWKLQVTGFQG
jgi:hypothetical protein